jgi:hypothetical protein
MSRTKRKNDCVVEEAAGTGILPAGTPDWITPELVEKTIRVWQPYYDTVLTPEEAITMIQSASRLFEALSSRPS